MTDSEGASIEDFAEFARTRDPKLRDRIIESNLGLARHLARRYAYRGEPVDDLVQVASLALVKAVDAFDPARAIAFSTFATRTIVGELKRYFRDRSWSVRPPRHLQELCLEVGNVIATLSQELGRSPTVHELAQACRASESEILEALEAGQGYRASSIDDATTDGHTVADELGIEEEGFSNAERRADLDVYLQVLPERERWILHLRFVEGRTQSEIAKEVGLSQMHVSRQLRAALAMLRDAFSTPSAKPAERSQTQRPQNGKSPTATTNARRGGASDDGAAHLEEQSGAVVGD